MRRTTLLRIIATLVLAAAASAPARADCSDSRKYNKSIVEYQSMSYPLPPFAQRDETAESICNVIHSESGQRVCEIKLWGAQYTPTSDKIFASFPALIFNHGSGAVGSTTYCELGKYFAEKGYLVLIPFRRGQGPSSHRSTGRDIVDLATDFENNPAHHNTTCTTKACYKAELLRLQADEEVVFAVNHLQLDDQVRKDDGKAVFAVGGNSFGGAVTVFFNRIDHGQRAVMAFAPAAQNWNEVNFAYAAEEWIISESRRNLLGRLLTAAQNAKRPAFYLQAKWDYDTRATIDLAYAHAYASNDPTHGHRFMASIFPYKKPIDPDTDQIDYQQAHTGFIRDTARWGPSVLAFLKLYGVD